MPTEIRSPRILIDPIDDALLIAGRRYLEYVANGTPTQKSRQYAIFEELLEDRLAHGDFFTFPTEEELPTDQLEQSDTITESQSIKIVSSVLRELEGRRNARYSQ